NPGQLSVAVGAEYVTIAVQTPGSATVVTFEGQVIEGGWLSLTVTVNEQFAVSLLESVTEQVTVVVPLANVERDAGLHTGVTVPQLSVAVTVKAVTAEHRFGSVLLVIFDGHVMAGGWLSVTVTVKLQVAFGKTPFEAVHVTVVMPFGN